MQRTTEDLTGVIDRICTNCKVMMSQQEVSNTIWLSRWEEQLAGTRAPSSSRRRRSRRDYWNKCRNNRGTENQLSIQPLRKKKKGMY